MPPAVAVNPAGGSKNGLHKAGSIHVDQERDVLISRYELGIELKYGVLVINQQKNLVVHPVVSFNW